MKSIYVSAAKFRFASLLIAVVISIHPTVRAADPMGLISQSRTVTALVTGSTVSASAPDYGLFNKSFYVVRGGGLDLSRASTQQLSRISGSGCSATAAIMAAVGNQLVPKASAVSNFNVRFQINQPVTCVLSGTIDWDQTYVTVTTRSPMVKLTGPAGVVFQSADAPGDGTSAEYAFTGTLSPGIYVLSASATTLFNNALGNVESKGYTLDFSVTPTGPVPPDSRGVYRCVGTLKGLQLSGSLTETTLSTADFVALALGQPKANIPANVVLAVVVNLINSTPERVLVWDSTTKSQLADLGHFTLESVLLDSPKFSAHGDLVLNQNGQILGSSDGVTSRLDFVLKGTAAGGTQVNPAISGTPVTGQILTVPLGGGTPKTTIITGGSFSLGGKIGSLP